MSQPYEPPPGAPGWDPHAPGWQAPEPGSSPPPGQYPGAYQGGPYPGGPYSGGPYPGGPYPGDPHAAPHPAGQHPHAWPVAYGWPAPGSPYGAVPLAPLRRKRLVVASVVGAVLLGVGVLVVVAVAGLGIGRTAGDELGAGFPGLPVPTTSAPSDSAGLGDDPGLDPYAERCEAGEMRACDELSFLATPESDYHEYGLTCGGRVELAEIAMCTYLE